jgi:hypothetical protein
MNLNEKVNFYYITKDTLEFINLEVFYGYERYTHSINLVYNYNNYSDSCTFTNKLEFKETLFNGLGHAKLEYNQITDTVNVNVDNVINVTLEKDKEYRFPLRDYIVDMRNQINELKTQLAEIKLMLD